MDQKYSKIFNKSTNDTITKFCELNGILDIDDFVLKCFKKGFDIERYGLLTDNENEVTKTVEIVKYVDREVIKEIPVEKIITKVEYVGNEDHEKELLEKIKLLETEMSKKNEELDELRRTLDIPVTNNEVEMLQETLQKLRKEIVEKNEKIDKLEQINKKLEDDSKNKIAVYMRGSNINKRL